jgi:D-alanine transaminase/branched-chain amino acid aminotransferase
MIDITVPASDEEIAEVIQTLIEKNGFTETNIKFILTGGSAQGGIEYNSLTPTFYILAEEFSAVSEKLLTEGAHVITYDHARQYPEYKTTNYITAVRLQKQRKEAGAIEVLYTHDGKILECATSNFFIVKNKN